MKRLCRLLSLLCALTVLFCALPVPASAGAAEFAFLKQSGHLESAYVEWSPLAGAEGYQVFVKKAAQDDDGYVRLDDPLVRKYPGYWRADALGLAAGEYVMKVVPVVDKKAGTPLVSDVLTVQRHDRDGYAFAGGALPGAYKADGTLKSGARVVYITQENRTSLQSAVNSAGGAPLAVRILGRVTNSGISGSVINVTTSQANLTIEGVGNDATAYGWGLNLKRCSHVEVRNLGVMLVASDERDGITLEAADYTWVHNCDFFYNLRDDRENDKQKGDGSLDTKRSHNVTHSYNHFWDSGKCSLQGSNIEDTSDCVTYHHNWYDHSDSRHPRVRVAHVHVYNNYYDNNDNYGIGAVYHATVFSECNYFDRCRYPMLMAQQGSDPGYFTGNSGTGEEGGMIKAWGNTVVGAAAYKPYSASNTREFDAYETEKRSDLVPAGVKNTKSGWGYDNFDTASDFYTYRRDAADDVPARVRAYAGRVEGGDFTFDMSTLAQDTKEPDAALLAALNSYRGSLVGVGGGESEIVEPIVGKTYTLTGDGVYALLADKKAGGALPAGVTQNAANAASNPSSFVFSKAVDLSVDDFFTLQFTANSRVDPKPAKVTSAWEDYDGGHQINFQNAAEAGSNAVKFTVSNRALVKVWWVGAVSAEQYAASGAGHKEPRPMVVLDPDSEVAAGPSDTVANDVTPMCSVFTLKAPGTYYLGGQDGKNFIYKVAVTVHGEAAEGWDSLSWQAEDGVLSVAGVIPEGETVWAACWGGEGFLGAKALTGADPAVTLDPRCTGGKLIWLDTNHAPRYENARF